MSTRSDRFITAAGECEKHIENYTVPQYGDFPNDRLAEMTAAECVSEIKKYVARYGRVNGSRERQLRDLMKIMHYASEAWWKEQGL